MKALPLPSFDRLAVFLAVVEKLGVWLEGLLDACFAMILEVERFAGCSSYWGFCSCPSAGGLVSLLRRGLEKHCY